MERATAIKKLRKLLGDKLGYRVDPKAPKQEEREEARAAIGPVIAERDAIVKQLEARRAVLLADPEYVRLKAEREAVGDRLEKLSGITRHYKITVGKVNSMFFSVEAEGDSWEQVIEKIEAAKRRAA